MTSNKGFRYIAGKVEACRSNNIFRWIAEYFDRASRQRKSEPTLKFSCAMTSMNGMLSVHLNTSHSEANS